MELAGARSLSTLAITDHDTIKGYRQARDALTESSPNLLPGVELTTLWNGREIHLLGYCFFPDDPGLTALLARQKKARADRMEQLLRRLAKKGVDISMDEIKALARGGIVGRPHVADQMVRKGVVGSKVEAFVRYLGNDILTGVQAGYATVGEAVEIIKRAGGVILLAHPGRLYSTEEVEELLHFGLDGLECIHPSHTYSLQKKFLEWAKREDLLIGGGSDFHGSGERYNPYFGVVTLSDTRASELERTATRRKELLL